MSKEDQADHTRGYDCCDFGNTSHIMGECPLCIDNMNKYNNEDGARMGGLKGDEHLGDRKGKEWDKCAASGAKVKVKIGMTLRGLPLSNTVFPEAGIEEVPDENRGKDAKREVWIPKETMRRRDWEIEGVRSRIIYTF